MHSEASWPTIPQRVQYCDCSTTPCFLAGESARSCATARAQPRLRSGMGVRVNCSGQRLTQPLHGRRSAGRALPWKMLMWRQTVSSRAGRGACSKTDRGACSKTDDIQREAARMVPREGGTAVATPHTHTRTPRFQTAVPPFENTLLGLAWLGFITRLKGRHSTIATGYPAALCVGKARANSGGVSCGR